MNDFERECQRQVDGVVDTLNEIAARENSREALEEYFDDVFDIEYRVDGRKEYRSVKVMITCGGPNIYVDTGDAYVRLYWGATEVEAPLSYNAAEKIDEIFEDWFRW